MLISTALLAGLTQPTTAPEPVPGLLSELPPAGVVEALAEPADDGERFELGVATFLLAVEELGQGLHELGPRSDSSLGFIVPILRLPVPMNDDPREVTPEAIAEVVVEFQAGLAETREILSAIDGPFVTTIDLMAIRLDLDGDGNSGEGESLGAVLRQLRFLPPMRGEDGALPAVPVDFDQADAVWLSAYCHLLEGFADGLLAHDPTELIERAGPVFFQRVETPHGFLLDPREDRPRGGLDEWEIIDAIAAIHLINMPVADAERLTSARRHFLAAIDGSRRMFELIAAETDAGREWIPGPDQTAALNQLPTRFNRPLELAVDERTIDAWLAVLDEAEAVLEGERLLPFWRGSDRTVGINLRRVFEEPGPLDMVLWIQGTAATPYLEDDKPIVSEEAFATFAEVTGGNFFGFAIWFN